VNRERLAGLLIGTAAGVGVVVVHAMRQGSVLTASFGAALVALCLLELVNLGRRRS
jgi:hypothetical protein